MSNVFIISDLHVPYEHPDYLAFCKVTKKKYKCGLTVCIGDLADNYAFSHYDKDPDSYSPGSELRKIKERLIPWFKAFPNVRACIGNHDSRIRKKAVRAGLPQAIFKSFPEFWDAPQGWEWNTEWVIDNVLYIHGDAFTGKNAMFNASERHRRSTVIGHCHYHAGYVFSGSGKNLIFGLNVGCGIDIDSYAFAYGKNNPYKPVLGCGVVIDGKQPLFIPMEV